MNTRELTFKEKQEIRNIVKSQCANYDNEYGCLLLDSNCFMFCKAYTGGALCIWFRNALLPVNARLKKLFDTFSSKETKPCKLCNREFQLNGRQAYCSEKCFKTSRRKSVAKNIKELRKRRGFKVRKSITRSLILNHHF